MLIFLIGWIVFSIVFAELAPLLFEGLVYLLFFLGQALAIAIATLIRGLWRLIVYLAKPAGRGLCAAFVFVWFFLKYWLYGPCEEQEDAPEYEDRQEDQPSRQDLYEAAIELFCLTPGFSRESFNSAFKEAIRRTHPDLTGNTEAAQEVNVARDLIKSVHGWT